MTRTRLMDLLRCASALSAGQRLILAGSQAFYAARPSAPQLVERSEEADLLLVGVERSLFLKLEEALGMGSAYPRETGVFAHPVGLGTITLVPDWEARLVPFGTRNSPAFCPEFFCRDSPGRTGLQVPHPGMGGDGRRRASRTAPAPATLFTAEIFGAEKWLPTSAPFLENEAKSEIRNPK